MHVVSITVYIPQYSSGTASLNVSCAAGIILYEFARWAQYKEVPSNCLPSLSFLPSLHCCVIVL
jgi:tRNA C32,U32 (ribose-2'-O)-methylase TrmJ